MSEENQNQQTQLAEELAAIKKQLDEAKQQAAESKSYMEGIQKAATGKTEPVQKAPHEAFVDNLLTKGDVPVRNLVNEVIQQRAYFDTLANNFKKENPHLEPMQEEIFGMTNQIVNNAAAQGQQVSWEAALKNATAHYDDKHKRLLKVSGASVPGPSGYSGLPNSRYSGCEEDYFAMSDADFKKVMDQKDGERKKRNRDQLSHYGFGR